MKIYNAMNNLFETKIVVGKPIALALVSVSLFFTSCDKEVFNNKNYGDSTPLSFSSHSGNFELSETKSTTKDILESEMSPQYVTCVSDDGSNSLQIELTEVREMSGTDNLFYIPQDTKSESITSVTQFYTAGFNGNTKWFPNSGSTQLVTTNTEYPEYSWIKGKEYNFYAYANIPTGMSASINESGVTLDCTQIPGLGSEQTDVVLGRYKGNGGGLGKAEMKFYHPLTSIQFYVESRNWSNGHYYVQNIEISGLTKSGKTSLGEGNANDIPTFIWNDTQGSGTVAEIYEINQYQLLFDGWQRFPISNKLGEPFFLIPQSLNGVQIKLQLKGGFNSGQGYYSATISDGSWEAGKSYTYTLKPNPCFVTGTLITLADGTKKPVEKITYEDELKVWNFDKGCYDTAKILWLTKKGLKNDHYVKCTFSDGTVLNVTGQDGHHKLYNYSDRFFEPVCDMEIGTEVYTENGVVTLISREWVDEEVEYYNLMTDKHINCFADGILTSSRLNNSYPVDINMKFIKDGRKTRPYVMFRMYGISREWYDGLRLGEQDYKLKTLKEIVERYESYMREKPQS